MKLRPYQLNAEKTTFEAWNSGARSVVGVLPTGTGKTVVFSSVIRRKFPRRAIVVAHRQELIWQAKSKIEQVAGLSVDVEMGEYKAIENGLFKKRSSVVVSSVQTLVAGGDGGGRIGKFDPNDFGLLIIDEAHHSTSPSYRKIINYFLTNPKLVVLGVTATPDRADEQALGQIFESVAFDYEILDAIKDGWLVPIYQQSVSVDSLDYSQVRTTAGDLNGADLAVVMEAEKNLHGIAYSTIDIAGQRRGIGFAASVNQARILSEICNRHRRGMSAFVAAGTDKDERRKIIKDFANGSIQWLWNCGVFAEGFDDSGVEIISMARPTKSRSLYAQFAGRGTRPHESIAHRLNECADLPVMRRRMIAQSCKPSCLIIDFVGNSGKHKLISVADILGGNMSEEAVESASNLARKAGKPVRMDVTVEEEEKRAEEAKQRRAAEEARKARLVVKATYKTKEVDPFDVLDLKPVKARGWDEGKQFSEKQRNFLRGRGIDPDKTDYARGKQLIGIIMDRLDKKLCTIKQASTLERFGYSKAEASAMKFEEASLALDAIAKNGWKRPANSQPVAQPVSENRIPEDDNVPF